MEKQQDDGIWIIDTDAKTAYVNERMAEILGTSPSEMVGGPSFAYVFPEDVHEAQRLFDAKTRGDTKPFHFNLRRKDGSAVWVYEIFFKRKARPKISRCSRRSLEEGKCILHSKRTDKFIEFDEALVDEVKGTVPR